MLTAEFSKSASPWFLVSQETVSDLTDLGGEWAREGFTVRFVRGQKMLTEAAMFDEVAAALQFPYYFGENWAAFDECLSDLEWLPAGRGYVVVILNALNVLGNEVGDRLQALVHSIVDAGREWSEPVNRGESWDREAIPFHVVLQESPDQRGSVCTRWSEAGAEFGPINM